MPNIRASIHENIRKCAINNLIISIVKTAPIITPGYDNTTVCKICLLNTNQFILNPALNTSRGKNKDNI